jgi:hypothetical protein
MNSFVFMLGCCVLCYGFVRIANAIKDISGDGIILYHQPRGPLTFEYERARDDLNWKVTAHPKY